MRWVYNTCVESTAHQLLKDSAKHDLRRISDWAASINTTLPQHQAQYHLTHARRKLARVPHEHLMPEVLDEIDALLEETIVVEVDTERRIVWAEKIVTLSVKI